MTVIRSPISPVIFSPLRAPTALYKGGGAPPLPDGLQAEYVAREFGLFLHFNMSTFKGVELASPSEPEDSFNPTDLDIDQWVATAVAMNAQYACLTAKHFDGFCLWPTSTTTHNITESSWYGSNPIDIVDEFCSKMRAADIAPVLYFNCGDGRYEIDNPGHSQAEFRAHLEAQITELLTNYGDIAALWMDVTEWYYESAYPWSSANQRTSFIRSFQDRNVVLVNNSHTGDLSDSDIVVYEDPTLIPTGNTVPSEQAFTILTDGGQPRWFWASGYALKTADVLIDRFYRTIENGGTLLLNAPPDTTGQIPSAHVSILTDLGNRVGAAPPVPGVRAAWWLDASDLDNMWQDRLGASSVVPAAVDSPVGSMWNKGLLGGWLVCGSDAARPILRESGGLYWLEFDGSNDAFDTINRVNALNARTTVAGVRRVSGNLGLSYSNSAPSRNTDFQIYNNVIYIGGLTNLYASGTYSATGSDIVVTAKSHITPPTVAINRSPVALTQGAARDWGLAVLGLLRIPEASFNGSNRIYQYISVYDDVTGDDLAALEAFVAAKCGVTLP